MWNEKDLVICTNLITAFEKARFSDISPQDAAVIAQVRVWAVDLHKTIKLHVDSTKPSNKKLALNPTKVVNPGEQPKLASPKQAKGKKK